MKRTVKAARPKPGRRKGGKSLELREAMLRAALEMELEEISSRSIASRAKASARMPHHFFVSMAGLHAAVAERGFSELLTRLEKVEPEAAGDARLLQGTLEYFRFGMSNRRLWRIMHSPLLWQGVGALYPTRGAAAGAVKTGNDGKEAAKERQLLIDVVQVRAAVLNQLMQMANPQRPEAEALVFALAQLVDGALFQKHFEQVQVNERQVKDAIARIVAGWSQPT